MRFLHRVVTSRRSDGRYVQRRPYDATKLPQGRAISLLAVAKAPKMRQKSNSTPASSETLVRNIRRATRKHHAAEEKIRIVLDGLRGETSIAELCRRQRSLDQRRASSAPNDVLVFLRSNCVLWRTAVKTKIRSAKS